MPFEFDDEQRPASGAFVFDDEQAPKKARTFSDKAADLARTVGAAGINALGSIPVAVGRAVEGAGQAAFGLTMDEAQRLAESDGAPERALEFYEKANRLNPVAAAGRAIESGGRQVTAFAKDIREGRSEEAKQAITDATPTGDITKPSTWQAPKDASLEGAIGLAAEGIGSMVPAVTAAVATRGRSLETQMRVGAGSVAAQVGGAAMDEARSFLGSMDDEKLASASPVYRNLLDKGYKPDQARSLLLRDVENRAATFAAPAGMVGGAATSALLGKAGERLAAGSSLGVRSLVMGVLGATEEGLQEVAEGTGTRAGINSAAGMNRSLTEGTVQEFTAGAMGGGPIAASRPLIGAAMQRLDRETPQGPGVDPAPAPAPAPSPTPPTPPVPPVPPTPQAAPEAVGTADTEEAARALRTPVNLGPLERADAIDAEIATMAERRTALSPENGYGPAFDQEREEITQREQTLAAERDQLSQAWPKTTPGARTTFSTEAGVRLEGQYALAEAADLITSHDEGLRANPAFPSELQPRDRTRQASELQVSGIVQRLDPARLGVSADSATGAPIIGKDGLVESGNARTIALKRVYQANGQKAEDYKVFLREQAAQFGLDPAAIDGMSQPVLVRVRNTPVNRAEFARQANQSTIQRMAPAEQALADSKRLNSLDGLEPDDNGDFDNSHDFIRQFMAGLPVTEQSGMLESDGLLSTEGYRRIQNAVLAKAYGDSPTLRRMTESRDDNLRNISKSLLRVAPRIAESRSRIESGTLNDADLTSDLLGAVEGLSALRARGWSVDDELAQTDLSGPRYSPESATLLRFLSENIRAPRRIAEFLQRYYEALEQAGNPRQPNMFDDGAPAPTRNDLINKARGSNDGNNDQDTQRGVAGARAQPAAPDRQQPEDAPGAGGRNEGDGATAADADGQPEAKPQRAGARGEEGADAGVDNAQAERQQAVDQFKGAMADLADIATKYARASMLPEDTPGLMPTLVKLFDAGIKIVGTDLRAATRWVKEQLKGNPATRKIWNKIGDDLYRKAALQALEKAPDAAQGGLFDSPAEATEAVQRSLFDAAPAAPAKPSNPKTTYRAYVLTDTDRKRLLAKFPVAHERVIADHISAQSLANMDKVREGPAKGEVIGTFDSGGIQALVVSINGNEKTEAGTPFHISWSTAPGVKSREVGPAIAKAGFTRLAQPVPLDLSAGPSYSAPLKDLSSDQQRKPGEADKAFAKRIVDKRPVPITLPETFGLYFDMADAKVVPMTDLVSTKSAEQNAQGGDNGAKRMAAAAAGELSRRAPITVMPSAEKPGKYEVVDGNGTLTSVSRYGWKSMPVAIVSRTEGLAIMVEDKGGDAQKAVKIDGRAYAYGKEGDNFKLPEAAEFISKEVVTEANGLVKKFYSEKPAYKISAADRTLGEAMVFPLLVKAAEAKADFDQAVIEIAQSSGAIGQMLAPIKGIKRAVEKIHQDADEAQRDMDPDDLKDLLRATIVVSSYENAQAVLDAIEKKFGFAREPKNRTETDFRQAKGKGRSKTGGYSDVLINVNMPNGTVAEIQINVPEMLSIKEHQGHKLFEAARDFPQGSARNTEIYAAMRGIYDAAFLAAQARALSTKAKKDASDIGKPERGPASSMPGKAMSDAPLGDGLNQPPSGNLTYSSPLKDPTNKQPGGKDSGNFMGAPFESSVPQITESGYTSANPEGESDADIPTGDRGNEGEGASAASPDAGGRKPQRVRDGSGRPNRGADGRADASRPDSGQVGQVGPAGVRGEDADGARDQPRAGAGRAAGVPAGRDIAPKSGRNFQFGPNDLTYEGSWPVKAEANLTAIETLKRVEAEGSQATREQQAIMAKYIGWGASELATNLFGKKLDKVAEAIKAYDTAIEAMDAKKTDRLSKGGQYRGNYADTGYYEARTVLAAANKVSPGNFPLQITREQLKDARPDAAARRWVDMRNRLREMLTPEELADAQRSTQYAHFTSKGIVKSVWKAVGRMGFKGGAVLEPGGGIGVFPGLMPPGMAASSSYTGIEFDAITGRILKQLFPDERILVESFIDTKLPKNFYDVSVGNPPFSPTAVLADPEYAKKAFKLHDYFFAKSMDRTKPGGLVVFVTSRYTMDKLNDDARKYLTDRADLVGAIRLPQTAFKMNAGTDVVTDVLFLRKKVPGETFELGKAWGKSVPMAVGGQTFPVNEYFHAHPEMVLGKHSDAGKMQNSPEPQYTVEAIEGDIEALFDKAVENLPADIYVAERGSSADAAKVREIDFNPTAKKEGNYYLSSKGELMQREDGVGLRVDLKNAAQAAIIKDFVPLRDALKQAHYDQMTDGQWEASLAALQGAYKAFTDKHGQINQFKTRIVKSKTVDEDTGEAFIDDALSYTYPLLKALEDDPDYTLVAALEDINEDTGVITPSKFMTARVLGKPTTSTIETPADALLSTLNELGKVDIGVIAGMLGVDEAVAIESLGSMVYNDPADDWVMADDYLSGNVKKKLAEARAVAQSDRNFERNVSALEAVQPSPKAPSQINAGLGMNWIDGKDYADFLLETAGVEAKIQWNKATKQWVVQEIAGGQSATAQADWGTAQRNATAILEYGLTGRPLNVNTPPAPGESPKFDPVATEAAQEKLVKMREAFSSWIWKDADRADRLVQIYNDRFNTTVSRKFDGSHMRLPGASKAFDIFPHVKRGAWRILQQGNTYLAHAVGSGKTFQMVIAAMEQKRLGLIKKPMAVVPNHMLKQFASEWQALYPTARLMVADEHNFHTENRRRFVSRVALSDLDGVIITQSAFKLLDLDPAFKKRTIEQELKVMRAAYAETGEDPDKLVMEEVTDLKTGKTTGKLKGSGSRDPTVKQIERQIERMEQKLLLATSSEGKDKNVRFDELGVDQLIVDEAHNYRKLDFTTLRQVKGIAPAGSGMAFDLFMKTRYLEEKNPGRSLVMASGTPITNTVAELYSVQKFMDFATMEERGIEDFDSWASMFGRERTQLEPNAAGKYEPVTRFTDFVNVPELTQMFRNFADVVTGDELATLLAGSRPTLVDGSRKIVVTPKTAAYVDYQKELADRVTTSRAWKPTKEEPNNPDPIIKIIGDGRLAAIDMRFVSPGAPSDPDSKLNKLIDDVIAELKATADVQYRGKDVKLADGKKEPGPLEPAKGSSMMVFSDLGFGAGVTESRGFNARGWFEKRLRDAGIAPAQIAFMSDYKKSSDKLKLFKDVNAGRVRLLVGSSKNMGTGVNAQQRLSSLFHLDSPWFPADLEQREGRIIRTGNKNKTVKVLAYAAKGTYDENMWKMLASKQHFIDQALAGDENLREIQDLDGVSQFDLAAGMVADDPRVLQLAGLQADIARMDRLYAAHEDGRARFRAQYLEAKAGIASIDARLPALEKKAGKVKDISGDKFTALAAGKAYTDRATWAQALLDDFKRRTALVETDKLTIGEISGFPIEYAGQTVAGKFITFMHLSMGDGAGGLMHDSMTADPSPQGLAMRAQNAVTDLVREPARMRARRVELDAQMTAVEPRLSAPFPMAGMMAQKRQEAADLAAEIEASGKEKPGDRPLVTNTQQQDDVDLVDLAMGASMGMIPPQIMLSRTVAGGAGMDAKTLSAVASKIKGKLPNLPKVHILADASKAPKALRDYIEKQGASRDVEAALHDGEIYIFASGVSDPLRVEHVLAEHEAAHFGLRAILGGALRKTMGQIYAQNGEVRRAATRLQARGKLSDAEATEEVIVDIATKDLARLKGWRNLVGAVRDWLADHGFDRMAAKLSTWLDGSLTDQQRADLMVADLVRSARQYVAGKRPARQTMAADTRLSANLAEDLLRQEKWLNSEARARGYQDIEDLLAQNYPVFEKLADRWRELNPADGGVLLSRRDPPKTAAERANDIIAKKAATSAPFDRLTQALTRVTGVERLTGAIYKRAGYLLDRYTPEQIKAGVVADYGVPQAVIDQRILLQGRQRVQLRRAGTLVEKLSTLTREESRVAYEWMNMDGSNPQGYLSMMQGLPEESVAVLLDVQKMIDDLSKEAVRMGQLSPEAFEKNRFAYLRRSYAKHILEQTVGDKAKRGRVLSILGDQYKGRGLSESAAMDKIKNAAPDWWGRKLKEGKGDAGLKGEKFVRLERRDGNGVGTKPLDGMEGKSQGKLREIAYWPAGTTIPAKYVEWGRVGTFEVRDVKGPNLILWRDFTKEEREVMGEVDEARFAIAKTLHAMVHDVEVGRYLEWMAINQAKKEGEVIPGVVVTASESMGKPYKPGDWVRVPDTKIEGTSVQKYGKLAGRYIPGPVWNDIRQVVGGQFKPFGETYAAILTAWKISKTALSPAVHMNNVMSSFIMADWHGVTAGHVAKSLRIMLGASKRDNRGLLGRTANGLSRGGIPDAEAAREIMGRYADSGGNVGSWLTNEIATDQLEPLLAALEGELAASNGDSVQAQTGVFVALQHALMLRFPSAWAAFKPSLPGRVVTTEASNLIDLYQSEDDVFRLAAWLKSKEEGLTDIEAGRLARSSFLDYSINAPWIQAMRSSFWPFVSFTYRAVPLLLEVAGKKPHKLMKLMLFAGGLNLLGTILAGGDADDEERQRKMLPREKSGDIWGIVPKLIRMPWNDDHGSAVYLDIRRFIPVGDVVDTYANQAAVPILPGLMPGGPLIVAAEVAGNKSWFTGKNITNRTTDTAVQQATKVSDHLFKAFAPNIVFLPNTYAFEGLEGSMTGRTDAFGREMSTAQAMASAFGVKLGSYPKDVMRRNLIAKTSAEQMEIDRGIAGIKRQRQTGRLDEKEFKELIAIEVEKKRELNQDLVEKLR